MVDRMASGELNRLRDQYGWAVDERLARTADRLWSADGATTATAFDGERHRSVDQAEATSWWYRTRNDMLVEFLEDLGGVATLWDVGAGSGLVARHLVRHGMDVVAVEPGIIGAQLAAEAGVPTLCSTLDALDLPDASVDAIGLFDVLEHVEDRPALLRTIRRVLAPGGLLVVTVPAYAWLWSGADEVAGHQLRYRARSLRRELATAGFDVARLGYRFASLLLPVFLLRAAPYRLGRRVDAATVAAEIASGPSGRLGHLASLAERRIGSRLPFGTSIFAAAISRDALGRVSPVDTRRRSGAHHVRRAPHAAEVHSSDVLADHPEAEQLHP
jgi:SAM-dependent methyltransferase